MQEISETAAEEPSFVNKSALPVLKLYICFANSSSFSLVCSINLSKSSSGIALCTISALKLWAFSCPNIPYTVLTRVLNEYSPLSTSSLYLVLSLISPDSIL